MDSWLVVAAPKKIEVHYENGKKESFRNARWRIRGVHEPSFELEAVPGGDGEIDAIDIYNCGYEVELVEMTGKWWGDEIDPDADVEESIWIWEFEVVKEHL